MTLVKSDLVLGPAGSPECGLHGRRSYAMNEAQIDGPVRKYLDTQILEVADFMRNTEY
jgi:hypothetical protein